MTAFSVIIPMQGPSAYLFETLEHLGRLEGPEFEVILLPDGPLEPEELPVTGYPLRIIPTGPASPAVKRDMGAEASTGPYLAFIDDDAYPHPAWLTKALGRFGEAGVVAVGGPQVTPPDDGFWQQVSGAMFLSPLNGGAVCRYWPSSRRFDVDDWPSVNLIVRKDDFLAVGGFDSAYWPGEDTKLCRDLVASPGKRIVYEPEAVVFHHRRSGFARHMRQVGNYGLHRGFFAKRFPETSRRPSYFIPAGFFLFVSLGWLALLAGGLSARLYLGIWTAYAAALAFSTAGIFAKVRNGAVALATVPYLVGTHFWYGWKFIKGFALTRELRSQLGR